MKLVEILAKAVSEWPEEITCMVQDRVGNICACTNGFPEPSNGYWTICGPNSMDTPVDWSDTGSNRQNLAVDQSSAIVTPELWQAERDRQKGGEWKRHRGGKQPVADGVMVDVKLNDGTQRDGEFAEHWEWRKEDADPRITQYRVISQPQAEEVQMIAPGDTREYKGPFPCAPAGEPVTELEWDIQFQQGIFHMEAKTDQIDGPIKWRDTVNELDAYIEEFTREREALINRLALEGFALIPAMTAVMGVSDDMNFWESWRVGDIIKVTNDHDIDDGQYAILEIEDAGYEGELPVKTYKGWPDTEYATLEFVSRP